MGTFTKRNETKLEIFRTDVALSEVSNGVTDHSLSANRKQHAMRRPAPDAARDLPEGKRQRLVFRR